MFKKFEDLREAGRELVMLRRLSWVDLLAC